MIRIEELDFATIMQIADDLGCPYKYPKMSYRDTEEEKDKKFKEYGDNICDWLVKNNYLERRKDFTEKDLEPAIEQYKKDLDLIERLESNGEQKDIDRLLVLCRTGAARLMADEVDRVTMG